MSPSMRPLRIVAVVLFLIAAISAFSASVNVNEIGFICLGLAALAAEPLVDGAGAGWRRPVARPAARRGFRRPL
jgi:hypothetical protein